jgi:Transglycosylase SLT domain
VPGAFDLETGTALPISFMIRSGSILPPPAHPGNPHLASFSRQAKTGIRPRTVVAIGFALAALTAGTLLALRPSPEPPLFAAHPVHRHKPPPRRVVVHKPTAKPAAPLKPAAPPKPSVYEQESAMSDSERIDRWNPLIKEASRRFAVSGAWIRAVMMLESGGRTMLSENRPITSSAGAMGLMQLMPGTYDEMRRVYGLGADPYDPHDNVFAGAAVLAALYKQYGYPTMFAAYNDGPGMMAVHARLSQALPAETSAYVRNIASILGTGVRLRPGAKGGGARLTRPDGSPVMLDAGAVVSVRAALPGEYAPGVQSVVTIGRLRQGVREDVRAATAIIRAHGGAI